MPNEAKNVCIPCYIPNCACSSITHELLDPTTCVSKSELSLLPDEQSIYMVDFDHVHQIIRSHYFKIHLRSSLYKCLKVRIYFFALHIKFEVMMLYKKIFIK